jgi:putative CocE/NonD family hydrolase
MSFPHELTSTWSIEKDLFVSMRDGVHLDTDVWLPEGVDDTFPTILVRTPYDKDSIENQVTGGWAEFWVRRGFAVVVQNVRGRSFSEGTHTAYLEGAKDDGADTLDWIVAQPWSNGRVGTMGMSSSADEQLRLGAANHPAHRAMLPISGGQGVGRVPGNDTQAGFYRGGVPILEFWAGWYANAAPVERLSFPPEASQQLRNRLRSMYSMRRPWTEFAFPVEHLPSGEVMATGGRPNTPLDRYLAATPVDACWDESGLVREGDEVRVPILLVDFWHDMAIVETLRFFTYLQEQGAPNARLIVGPGGHGAANGDVLGDSLTSWAGFFHRAGLVDAKLAAFRTPAYDLSLLDGVNVGDARYGGVDGGYTALFFDWFSHWLRDDIPAPDLPAVQVFVMGRGWVTSDRWPLAGTRELTYYLDGSAPESHPGSGSLGTSPPDRDGSRGFVYDPGSPTPHTPAGSTAVAPDQRPIEARADVLVYTTPPFERPLDVVGAIEVVLHVSSSARDTDFMVKVTDVDPSGASILLTQDAFRVRYRDGFDREVIMEDGEVYEIVFTNLVTARRFEPGHRIRVNVASSGFALYERNLNTGGRNHEESEWVVARNVVHHGPSHPSRIVLQFLPADE